MATAAATSIAEPSAAAVSAAVVAGCLIALISFGFPATFGIFLRPMSEELGWGREVFSLSIAIQMLCWGVAQPLAGMVADRFGTARVLAFGAIMAALGFLLRGAVIDPTVFVVSGAIVGIGGGSCSFAIVVVALGKVVPAARRSFVLGLGTAAASTGMFLAAPASSMMLDGLGWQNSILVIAACFLLILPALIFIARVSRPTVTAGIGGGFGPALRMAFSDRAYVLLFFGFYVCGFHVAFIGTHLPAYVADQGFAPIVGAWSLGLIGLFNIAGSFASGWSGQIYSKKKLLSGIYFARGLVIIAFILLPLSPVTIYGFSALMGLLWLSTIPLTIGLVATTQGLRFMSTLTGLVFFSHQIGSFTGSWLGGRIYDATGSYEPMWWAGVALAFLATLLHLPIRESPGKLAQAEAGA